MRITVAAMNLGAVDLVLSLVYSALLLVLIVVSYVAIRGQNRADERKRR